ncbi:GreA/GreB family elongation factor [Streptomyces sp. NPDC014733]|uniref:GreA/GreB family elongation factor n=1 Tax=Streptomyces sp. NPDC014733 TaxID=3364885 RepID=UPI0037033A05
MSEEPEPISAAERRALERDRDALRAARAADAPAPQDSGQAGDRGDAADQSERVDEATHIGVRLAEITLRLHEGERAGVPPVDAVGVGSTCTVRFPDGDRATLHLARLASDRDPTLVTADSPLGRALLGHEAGDRVEYTTPDGRETVHLLSVGEPGPENGR